MFGFINVQLFNQLLLRRECCSFNNGEYVKSGLAELENWLHKAGEQWVGQSLEELRYIRQVLGVYGSGSSFQAATFGRPRGTHLSMRCSG